MNKAKIRLISFLVMILIGLSFVSFYFINISNIQKEAIEQLEEIEGKYNPYSIVLNNTNKTEAEKLASLTNSRLRIIEDGSFAVLYLDNGLTIKDIYKDKSLIEYIDLMEPNYYVQLSEEEIIEDNVSIPNYTFNDPYYSYQSYLNYINVGDTWNQTTGEDIKIAVIDTGIDTDHIEFDGKISELSYDATNDKRVKDYGISVIEDEVGHGTMVAGVIAASINNEEGVVGIASSVELIVIKCEAYEDGSFVSTSDLQFAIYYAIECDVSVINMSFGVEVPVNPFEEQIQLAVDSDIICVAAAGNLSSTVLTWPAADPNVIGVGALKEDSFDIADYSNYGDNSDIVAPGTVYTTSMDGGYIYTQGTSFSSPIVASAIGLYLSINKYQEYSQVKEMIIASSLDLGTLGEDWYYGYGALDMNALICEEVGTITFDYLTDEISSSTQKFVRGHTLQNIPDPEREVLGFDGWYYDIHCIDEYALYEDKFTVDLTLYASWISEVEGIPYEYIELSDGTIEITKYIGRMRYITVPSFIEGKSVSSIGSSAFANNSRIREVILPEELKYIRNRAFYCCNNLLSISIPKTVIEIESNAFSNCVRMREVNIPTDASLTSIGGFAFSGCGSLSRFDIPNNLTRINGSVFYQCSALQTITVAKLNQTFKLIKKSLYTFDGSTLIYYPTGLSGEYEITHGTLNIADYAFACSRLTLITLPDTVINIGSYTFSSSSIKEMSLPESVETLGIYVFFGCTKLKTITFSENCKITNIPSCAFSGCSSLKEIEIPSSVISIGGSAFSGSSIKEMSIPESVETLGDYVFYNCTKLKTITFSENCKITSIPSYAFSYCSSLEVIEIPSSVISIDKDAFYWCSLLSSVVFKEVSKLTSIGERAFSWCSSLEEIEIPSSIISIGESAFSYCSSLLSVIFKEGSKLTSISEYAFYRCSSLKGIILPNSLISIGIFSFSESGLESVSIPSNLTSIGIGSFSYCTSLTSIIVDSNNTAYKSIDNAIITKDGLTLHTYAAGLTGKYNVLEGITLIGSYAFGGSLVEEVELSNTVFEIDQYGFYEARQLKEINLNEGLSIIDHYGFYYCSSLEQIQFPDSLTELGISTFSYCSKLGDITITKNIIAIARYAFSYCYNIKSITFASDCKISRLGYATFANTGVEQITLPNSIDALSQGVFEGCDSLTKVTFSEGSKLRSISAYMFSGANSLETIEFKEGNQLTNIQARGLEGLQSLRNINLEDCPNLVNIDNYAFQNCKNLENIIIPNTVTYIGRYAFNGCSKLSRVDIPASVEYIGRYAFTGCNNINVYFTGVELPEYIQEEWDYGINAYYVGVKEVRSNNEYQYAILNDNTVSIIKYNGSNTNLSISTIDDYVVSSIGGNAFVNNKTLVSIKLSDNITSIYNNAFKGCTSLTSINIPSSIKLISDSVFSDSGLNSVTFDINSRLTKIGKNAFSNTSITTITIPSLVEIIDDNAFSNSSISEVIFEEGSNLTTIGESAFTNSKIESITLPNKIELIDYYAFYGSSLKEVVFPTETELRINGNAFYMTQLEEVYIPNNVYYIGELCFNNCSKLTSINVDSSNEHYTSIDGVLYSKNEKVLITFPGGRTGSYEIPNTVTIIGTGSFEGSSLTSITFEENSIVMKISARAFISSRLLESITIPDSVHTINYYAFAYCDKLSEVNISENSQISSIFEGAFYNCSSLTSIVIPKNVQEIKEYTYYGCSNVTSINIPEDSMLRIIYAHAFSYTGIETLIIPSMVTEIDEMAFCDIKTLKEVYIPESVLYMGSNVFDGCDSLEKITIPFIGEEAENDKKLDYVFGSSISNIKEISFSKEITSIGDYAFSGCSSLASITISESVTRIGNSVFSSCTNLTSITIPNNVTSIGNWAFFGCSSLTSIRIPENVTKIEDYAFRDCTNLTSITIPENVISISRSLFENCNNLTSIILSESVTSIGDYAFNGCTSLASITIPESVTSIGNYTFSGCSSITSITIPESVTSIGDYAFNGCTSLASITIPESVTSIGNYTFSGCSSITSITIPESVTSIGNHAFSDCISLTNITIPESVISIGNSAFRICTNLTSIIIPESVISIGYNVFSGCANLTIYLKADRLPEMLGEDWNSSRPYLLSIKQVVDNDEYSYCVDNTDKLTIIKYKGTANNIILDKIDGYEVISIVDSAFKDCTSLTNITLPSTITSMGDSVFYGCTNLTSIIIPESVTSIGNWAFYCCSSLTSIIIPEGVTSIGDVAFGNCSSLTSIIIPESVTSIGHGAFICYRNITICFKSDSLPKILGSYWNGDSSYVLSVKIFVDNDKYSYCVNNDNKLILLKYKGVEQNLIIDQIEGYEIIEIGNCAFENCTSLTSITILNSVTKIEYSAFRGCTSLTSITLPDNITSIGKYVFNGCYSLTNITIPEGVTSIGDFAFNGCESLTSITIPEGVTSIGEDVFNGCYSLTNITIPEGVTSIGKYVFNGCYSLTNITIPEGVTSIGNSAFKGCESLTSITIPEGVTSIGNYAFYNCSSLVIYFRADGLPKILGVNWNDSRPYYLSVEKIVYNTEYEYFINNGKVTIIKYKSTKENIIIDKIDGYEVISIGNYAFYNCSRLVNITIPESVTSIGDYTFYDCSTLKSITLSGSVTSIGDYAFSGCNSLTNIIIPESVVSINHCAFSNCSSLTSMIIPKSVIIMGADVFQGCYNLLEVTVEQNINIVNKAWSLEWNYGCNCIINYEDTYTNEEKYNGFEYNFTSDGVYISKCTSTVEKIEIPGDYYGCNIIGIKDYAFSNCTNVSFSTCTTLTNIVIPDNIKTIGDYAFYYCVSLTSITIPESVTSIGRSAFYGCTKLTILFKSSQLPQNLGNNWNGQCPYYLNVTDHFIFDDVKYIVINNDYAIATGCLNQKYLIIHDSVNDYPVTICLDSVFNGRNYETICLPTYDDGFIHSDLSILKYLILGNHVINILSYFSNIEIYCYSNKDAMNINEFTLNNSKVYYNGEFNIAKFYVDGELYSYTPYPKGRILQAPANNEIKKESNLTTKYNFIGWDINGDGLVDNLPGTLGSNLVANAVFEEERIGYEVIFKNYDGTVLSNEVYQYNDDVIIPSNPTKQKDIQYSYEFIGWDKEISKVTSDIIYTAKYKEILNQYTVKFINYDESILLEQLIDYGTNANYNIDNPIKDLNDDVIYTFVGWNIDYSNIIGNIIVKALFKNSNQYKVSFFDENNELIESQIVDKGNSATAPNAPLKASDKTYTYTFTEWDKEYTNITEDLIIKPLYQSIYIDYTIKFIVDDVIIDEKQYHYGDVIILPNNPTKESDNTYTYEFSKWDKYSNDLTVLESQEFIAIFTSNYIDYTITFVNYDDEVLLTDTYHYGSTVVKPNNPTKPSNETYDYEFIGWDSEVVKVNGNKTYKAVYKDVYVEYIIVFKDNEGNILGTATHHYGETVEAPTVSNYEDNTYTYVFSGWDNDVTEVNSNKTYTASYKPVFKEYVIEFVDYDDTLISSKTYHYTDEIIVPTSPSKPSDNTYTYTFTGWDSEVITVDGNKTYKAVYSSTYIDYTITFVNYDDSIISKDTYHCEDTVKTPTNPTKPSDNTYTYTFTGWNSEVTTVEGNKIYKAVYSSVYIDYTITFVNYDDSIISKDTYHYGDTVKTSTNPTKPSDNTYTYTFTGWDSEVTTVNGNKTYKAVYSSTYIDYTITFVNYDDSIISKDTYHYGDTVKTSVNPTKPSDNIYDYTFSGWDSEVTTVDENKTYKAVYKSTYIDYTITFVNYNDEVLSTNTYHYGNEVIVPINSTKLSDNTYTYTFTGWDSEVTTVNENKTYKAVYSSTYIDYIITFVNYNDEVLLTNTYHYGDTVKTPTNPTKPSDNTYNYTFTGWDSEVTTVDGNKTYKAVYSSTYIYYTITFVNYDDSIISKDVYHYGDEVIVQTNPSKPSDNTYTYTFTGWDSEVTTANVNKTYKAVYKSTYIDYLITFVNYDDSFISEDAYHYGDTIKTPTNPTKPSDNTYDYTFTGWDSEVTTVNENKTYKAVYSSTYIDYTITFVNYNNEVLLTNTYHYGDEILVPDNPVKESDNTYIYEFTGWDSEVTTVNGNKTYKAVYSSTYIDYTITFVNYNDEVLLTNTYHYEDTVKTPTNPTKPNDNTYTYTFTGWDSEVTTVDGNKTYKAMYDKEYIDYIIEFIVDGKTYQTNKYHYLDKIIYPVVNNIEYEDKVLVFNGWNKTITNVIGNDTFEGDYTTYLLPVITKSYEYNEDEEVILEVKEIESNIKYSYEWKNEGKVLSNEKIYNAGILSVGEHKYECKVIIDIDNNGNIYQKEIKSSINVTIKEVIKPEIEIEDFTFDVYSNKVEITVSKEISLDNLFISLDGINYVTYNEFKETSLNETSNYEITLYIKEENISSNKVTYSFKTKLSRASFEEEVKKMKEVGKESKEELEKIEKMLNELHSSDYEDMKKEYEELVKEFEALEKEEKIGCSFFTIINMMFTISLLSICMIIRKSKKA